MSNSDFFKSLKTTNVRYMLCDLHVHSIASADVLIGDRYNQLDTNEKRLIESLDITKENFVEEWKKYEELILKNVSIEDYFKLIEKHRNEIAVSYDLSGSGNDWAILAITDHNTCKFSCELSQYSWANKKDTRIVILPGIELEVDFKINATTDTAKAHICLIFAPNTTAPEIHTALNMALAELSESKCWDFGDIVQTKNLNRFIRTLRHNDSTPAICIAAHVSSSKGIRGAALEVLNRSQAEFITASAEYEELKAKDPSFVDSNTGQQIKKRIKELQQIVGNENVNLQVLKVLGRCGFDALQVRNLEDDKYYRCLHRFNEDFGRAVPILCSDAHNIDGIFDCEDDMIPYIKFPAFKSGIKPNVFHKFLRNYSLRFGETRFTSPPKDRTSCYIKGIEISPETDDAKKFWPFDKDSFYLSFSSNLNCLIGGRGSGKSALIEALAFLLDRYSGFDPFNEQAGLKEDNQEDWYKRAYSTLAGCNVKICWTSTDSEFSDLKRRSLFLDRYFDPDEKYDDVVYMDLDGEQVLDDDIINSCEVNLYRMSQLEELAVDEKKMRDLFDGICGYEVEELGEEIEEVIEQLGGQEDAILNSFDNLAILTRDKSPLRTYVIRKAQYDKVNSKEFKDKYDKLDKATKAKRIASAIKKDWEGIIKEIDIEELKASFREFFKKIKDETSDKNGVIFTGLESFRKALLDKVKGTTLEKDLLNKSDSLEKTVTETSETIKKTGEDIAQKEMAERNLLQREGVPVGASQRASKKKAYDEAEEALKEYEEETKNLKLMLGNRNNLFSKLKSLAKARTELRTKTAKNITEELSRNLDSTILVVEADAQPMADKNEFIDWLDENFFPDNTKNKEKKIEQLLHSGLIPEKLKAMLLKSIGADEIKNDITKSALGRITLDEAEKFIEHASVRYKCSFDEDIKENSIDKAKLPETITKGISVFTEDEDRVKAYLDLDKIVFDDIPEIRLMDRPNEMDHARLITGLSPGQRCSAILPIILLNGNTPLIIDQPEDNLDNRLIREVVVNILAAMKLRRQIIIATHNPNLPVLGDVEQAIILRATEQDKCQLQAKGDIENDEVVNSITEIMEGGREAFQYRQSIYQAHWKGPIQEVN